MFGIINQAQLRNHEITADGTLLEMNYKGVVIDVRSYDEYSLGHIPGSINILSASWKPDCQPRLRINSDCRYSTAIRVHPVLKHHLN